VSSLRKAGDGAEAYVAVVGNQAKGELKKYVYTTAKDTLPKNIKKERLDSSLFVTSAALNGIGAFEIRVREYDDKLDQRRYGDTVMIAGAPEIIKNN